MIIPRVFESPSAATAAAADMFLEASPAQVAFAGGSTPKPMYELLARSHHSWVGTEVFLTDERCVPLDNPQSNYLMLRECLGATGANIHAVDTSLPPERAAQQYAEELSPYLPLDFVVLGVGTDGHTASLFPGCDVDPGHDAVAAWSKDSGLWRVTLTARPLAAALHLIYLVTGAEKSSVVQRIMRGDPLPPVQIAERRDVVLVCDVAAFSPEAA